MPTQGQCLEKAEWGSWGTAFEWVSARRGGASKCQTPLCPKNKPARTAKVVVHANLYQEIFLKTRTGVYSEAFHMD